MDNGKVAAIFSHIAQILEIKGENIFRIRAYERVARVIEGLTEDIGNFVKDGRLDEIPGVGADLADKITEIVTTGKLKFLDELEKTIPDGLLELLDIPSIGPKTAALLYKELNIHGIADLEKAIAAGKLLGLPGIKEKTIENIERGIEIVKKGKERMLLPTAQGTADEFITALKKCPQIKKLSVAGSLRRFRETVRDIDILVVSENPSKIMDVFTHLPQVKRVQAKGETKSSILTQSDTQVDLRVVEEKSFGAALFYFTGSKNFNIRARQIAIKKGYKLNEYGLFKGEKYVAGKTEEDIFKKLGMDYIVPEMREDTGEIALALASKLPALIEVSDIKGDLHLHSTWSDGTSSIEDVARACMKRGYHYAALTDHSESLKVARGLTASDLKKKKAEIDALNKKLKNFTVFYGTEVEIDSDGNIDYSDDILKHFDIVVGAIHTGFKQSKEQLTRRIVKACKNKYVNIIAHPTGRLWGTRPAYDIDFEQVLRVCRDTNTALEINSFPNRLDLDDIHCRAAKEALVKIAISTDSHAAEQLGNIRLGVAVARRGWLSKEDVLNTLSKEALLKAIRK